MCRSRSCVRRERDWSLSHRRPLAVAGVERNICRSGRNSESRERCPASAAGAPARRHQNEGFTAPYNRFPADTELLDNGRGSEVLTNEGGVRAPAASLDARTRHGVPMSMCVHRDSVSYMPYRRRGDWIKIKAAARAAGLSDYIVFSRLRNGWTLEKALNTPVRTVRTRTDKRSSGSRFDARGVESAHRRTQRSSDSAPAANGPSGG